MGIINKAHKFIEQGKVKLVSISEIQILISVNGHVVKLIKKQGRSTDSCDCRHHARFCKENPRCAHKEAASCFRVMKGIDFLDKR